MSECRNNFLSFYDLAALGAFFTFGKTGFGTGRIYCRNGYFVMLVADVCSADVAVIVAVFVFVSECGNFNIGGIVASGAGFVCFPAGFGAGCVFAFVLNFVMSECGNNFSRNNGNSANGAFYAAFETAVDTISRYVGERFFGMTGCLDYNGFFLINSPVGSEISGIFSFAFGFAFCFGYNFIGSFNGFGNIVFRIGCAGACRGTFGIISGPFIGYCAPCVVTERSVGNCGNFVAFGIKICSAVQADLIFVPTLFAAGGIFCVNNFAVVVGAKNGYNAGIGETAVFGGYGDGCGAVFNCGNKTVGINNSNGIVACGPYYVFVGCFAGSNFRIKLDFLVILDGNGFFNNVDSGYGNICISDFYLCASAGNVKRHKKCILTVKSYCEIIFTISSSSFRNKDKFKNCSCQDIAFKRVICCVVTFCCSGSFRISKEPASRTFFNIKSILIIIDFNGKPQYICQSFRESNFNSYFFSRSDNLFRNRDIRIFCRIYRNRSEYEHE